MSKKPRSKKTPENSADPPEYLDGWARDLIAALGKPEAHRVLADYQAIATNRRLSEADRDVAAQRVIALERHM